MEYRKTSEIKDRPNGGDGEQEVPTEKETPSKKEGALELEEDSPEEYSPEEESLSWRQKLMPRMAKVRDSARSVVMVGLAGMAAYLTSVLLAIPLTRLLEPWIAGGFHLSSFQRVVYGALVLDLPKILAALVFSFAYGRFVQIRAWASGLGILATIYMADGALSYVIGSFGLTWGSRYALIGRAPLAVLGFLMVVVVSLWGRRRQRIGEQSVGEGKTVKKSAEGVSHEG